MQDNNHPDIQKLEQQLADLSPCPLSDNLIARMEQAMISWESNLPAEEKIVPFQSSSSPNLDTNSSSNFSRWSAAAAVALIGAVGITFISSPDETAEEQLRSLTTIDHSVQQQEPTNTTKQFSHQLMNASNEGITYAGNDKPYRVIRIEYIKEIKQTDSIGMLVCAPR